MNIRDQALRSLREGRFRWVSALACPASAEVPRHKLGATIFPPVRQPSNYGRGTTGKVHCHKAGGLVPFESAIERAFFRIMEWDYTVDSFVAQPFKVPYTLSGQVGGQEAGKAYGQAGRRLGGKAEDKVSWYTPDCFAISYKLLVNSEPKYAPTAFEIKSKQELRERWPELKPKLKAARRFLGEAGFRFRLLTEDQIHPVFLENITFLLRFRGERFFVRTPAELKLVDRLMYQTRRSNDDFTPRELIARASDLAPREQIIPWMWNLYADYVFQCDLLKPLTLDTVSWRAGDAGAGFPNCGYPSDRPDWRQPENDWRR